MRYAGFEDLTWHFAEALDIFIGVNDGLPRSRHADVVYARLEPGATLKRHIHRRSTPDGYEAFFFFAGGHIRLLLGDDCTRDIDRKAPFHVSFENDDIHGVANLSDQAVYFEVICAPCHEEGEESVLE